MKEILIGVAASLAFLAAGCGSAREAAQEPAPTDHAPTVADDHHGEDMPEGHLSFGAPGDADDADRTIRVVMRDDFSYDPLAISVHSGETVTFEVVNQGELPHEFVLGDTAVQEEHGEEMAETGSDMMHEEPYAVSLPSGETGELTWTFGTEGAQIEFACHEPGHYEAGMVGELTIAAG